MRKVLLILDGIVAKEFLSILVARHLDKNAYIFVSLDKNLLPQNLPQDNECFSFDPSSPSKLREILTAQITDCYIITDKREERRISWTALTHWQDY